MPGWHVPLIAAEQQPPLQVVTFGSLQPGTQTYAGKQAGAPGASAVGGRAVARRRAAAVSIHAGASGRIARGHPESTFVRLAIQVGLDAAGLKYRVDLRAA